MYDAQPKYIRYMAAISLCELTGEAASGARVGADGSLSGLGRLCCFVRRLEVWGPSCSPVQGHLLIFVNPIQACHL